MKKLALLLVALPLVGCALGPSVPEELAEAKAYCGPRDLHCVANFTEKHYHMRLYQRRDGSLTLLAYSFGQTNDYP